MRGGDWIVLAILALGLTGPVAVLSAGPVPEPFAAVLVVTPPWVSATEVIQRAGGALRGPVQPRLGRIASSQDPEFENRLRREGAWLIINDTRLLAFCGVRS